jgi:hypothetical protein
MTQKISSWAINCRASSIGRTVRPKGPALCSNEHHNTKTPPPCSCYHIWMGSSFVISGLRQKRARIVGEITQARKVIDQRTEELAAVDTVLRLFAPDCDPDMIPPIKPASHGLFFRYRELGRICINVLRKARGPVKLDRIAAVAIEVKGLPDDTRLRKHVADTARASLMRLERRGLCAARRAGAGCVVGGGRDGLTPVPAFATLWLPHQPGSESHG